LICAKTVLAHTYFSTLDAIGSSSSSAASSLVFDARANSKAAYSSAKWQISFRVSTGFHWFSGFRELGNLETQKPAHDPEEKIKY
jgi:hypothetical protein